MPRTLLIVSCSDAKTFDVEPIPAIRRYDGPLWQTLRSTLSSIPASAWPSIAALSAEHGLIEANTPIADYDRRMNEARAAELARDPDFRASLADLAGGKERIYVAGGKLYRDSVTLAGAYAAIPTMIDGAPEGTTIGHLRQRMRSWLLDTFILESEPKIEESEIEASLAPVSDPVRLGPAFRIVLGALMRVRSGRGSDVDVGSIAGDVRASGQFQDLGQDDCVALALRSIALFNTLAEPEFEAPLAADPDGARPIAMAIASELPVLAPENGGLARFRKQAFVARFVRAVVERERAASG